jgi:hypothetical protein
MKFTGTLIEDLTATVERAERRAQSERALPVEPLVVESLPGGSLVGRSLVVESFFVESLLVEPWFASVQKNRDYNSKFIGVA